MHGSIGCHMAVHDRKVKEIEFLLQDYKYARRVIKGFKDYE